MVPNSILDIDNLHVYAGEKQILRGVTLSIRPGEVLAVMGPNGSGKSTLANVIAGSPELSVQNGDILFKSRSILNCSPDERARLGIFLAFQNPEEIPGVPVHQFLRQAMAARRGTEVSVLEARFEIDEWISKLGIDSRFAKRSLNEKFSGGEKKRNEILQMALLNPELCILDEVDSGLDVDGLKLVIRAIEYIKESSPNMSFLLISHYYKVFEYLEPNFVHVMYKGQIVESGDVSLAKEIDNHGYDRYVGEKADV